MKSPAKKRTESNKKGWASAQLGTEMSDAIDRVAITMRRPRSFIIREAIAYYLATQSVK